MTPKEKAENLTHKLREYTEFDVDAHNCILIFIDEIIATAMTGYLLNDQSVSEFQIKMRDYWQSVKEEVKKL